jgi:NAD(P)-dependent dehydrogenase (short-subunit alcohol dehydrogenase family)
MARAKGPESEANPRRTALVTGANRGIGLEVCRQLARLGHRVILTGRDAAGVAQAGDELSREGLEARTEVLDVASEESVGECAERLRDARESIDILVNNAAIYPQGGMISTSSSVFRETFDINILGAVWTCRAWAPEMKRRDYGRIVNVSSGYGAFSGGLNGPAAYCVTKAALNALTVRLAYELSGDVKVNAADPGWVRTRMGGSGATRGVEKGAQTVVWLATLPADGPSGGFFHDRRRISW